MTVILNCILLYTGSPVCPKPFRASSAKIHPVPHLLKYIPRPFSLKSPPLPFLFQIFVPLSAQISAPLLPKHILAPIPQGYLAAAPLPAPPRRWCMENTCMIFVVYWCIFLHITMLLVVIITFYGDFPLNPLISVITLHDRKAVFCVFLSFKNLPKLKLTWDFWSINILSWEAPED
jgi:hypothetical protein